MFSSIGARSCQVDVFPLQLGVCEVWVNILLCKSERERVRVRVRVRVCVCVRVRERLCVIDVCMYVCIYTYVYTEREGEREVKREREEGEEGIGKGGGVWCASTCAGRMPHIQKELV